MIASILHHTWMGDYKFELPQHQNRMIFGEKRFIGLAERLMIYGEHRYPKRGEEDGQEEK